ncbi:MAG: glycosyltransferase, partial [Akkermansia sp.]|nr:glycosyltransferase [Akkermansia sp.]
ERITVIPNSVDITQHYPEYRPSNEWYDKWYAQYPELKGKYVICLPGRVARQKGAEHLVPVLLSLKKRGIPAHALLVGEVKKRKQSFRKELLKKYEKAGLTQDITWTGLRRDIRDIMVASDVVISLNLVPEPFGKTTLEALALGRPMAGYEAGGVGEQLSIYLPEGKVKTGDPEAMADVLAAWYQNPRTPHKPVSAPHRRQDMIDAYIAVYKELCEQ